MTWLDLAILLALAGAVALWAYEWRALRRDRRQFTERQDRELRELRTARRRRGNGGRGMISAPIAVRVSQGAPALAPASPSPRLGLGALSVGRASLPRSIVEAPAGEGVYLLAFLLAGEHVAYGASASTPHAGGAHYCGWARNIRERVCEHATGAGARLTLAAFLAGYEMRLVRVWPHAGRDVERRMKQAHRLGRYCPLCKYRIDPAPIPAPILDAPAIGAAWAVEMLDTSATHGARGVLPLVPLVPLVIARPNNAG